jgi:hypothetical protein
VILEVGEHSGEYHCSDASSGEYHCSDASSGEYHCSDASSGEYHCSDASSSTCRTGTIAGARRCRKEKSWNDSR